MQSVTQAAQPSGLSAEKVGHGFRQDFLSYLRGKKTVLNALPSSKVDVRFFFPLSVAKQSKKERKTTKQGS